MSVGFDQYYVNYTQDEVQGWLGRRRLSIAAMNELVWDADIPLFGGSIGVRGKSYQISTSVGRLPIGLDNGDQTVAILQGKGWREFGDLQAEFAAHSLRFATARSNDSQRLSGDLRYWINAVETKLKYPINKGRLVWHMGAFINSADQSVQSEDDNGFAVWFGYEGKAWRTSLGYAEVGGMAVHSAYAQDDWVRWGSETTSRGANFRGFELSVRYALTEDLDLMMRYYDVKSLSRPEGQPGSETGKRLRLDLNHRF